MLSSTIRDTARIEYRKATPVLWLIKELRALACPFDLQRTHTQSSLIVHCAGVAFRYSMRNYFDILFYIFNHQQIYAQKNFPIILWYI